MNYELDELLDLVDGWKFKVYEKIKGMTPKEESEFWKKAEEKARTNGFRIAGEQTAAKQTGNRRRATG